MKPKNILFFMCLFLISGLLLPAQKNFRPSHFSAGAGSGIVLLFGDIGNMGIGSSFHLKGTYSLNKWAFRISFLYGTVSDSDEGTAKSSRNYAYRSVLWQPSVQAVYSFFVDKHRGYNKKKLVRYWDRWRVDVIGGLSFPYAVVAPGNNFSPTDLSKLKSISLAIPFGVGVQYGISENLAVRGELMPQFVFSDYMDGFSSPYSEANDFMYLLSVSIIYNFPDKHNNGAIYCPY